MRRRGGRRTIGIVGLEDDPEVQCLAFSLAERGAEVRLVDFRNFPDRKAGMLGPTGLRYAGGSIEDLEACYIRVSGYNWPYADTGVPAEVWRRGREGYLRFLEREVSALSFKECLLRELSRRIPVVNPQPLQELHRLKVFQLHLLRKGGISVPETLASNDAGQLERFGNRIRSCVRKPLAGVLKTHAWRAGSTTQAELARSPVLLQRFMRGRTIRCYVVGRRLVAAGEILHGGAIDSSIEQRGVRLVNVPQDVRRQVLGAARALGLLFSGIDVQHDVKRDRYAILECNVSPMFSGFSRMTGADVPGALADLLVALARAGHRR